MPVIARSQFGLVEILQTWIGHHEGKLPPGAIRGSILNVKYHEAKTLYFTNTTEAIVIDRLLINKTTIEWVLRAQDGSCMFTRDDKRSGQKWHGYSAWFGGDSGFTKAVLASTDGNHQKPPKNHRSAAICDASTTEEEEALKSDVSKLKKNPGSAEESFHAVKLENRIEGHRYPTRERRLAMFVNGSETWESQGNRGSQTPPRSGVEVMNPPQGVPWHPGTPPPTPPKRLQRQARKLQEASSLQSKRTRSPSLEVTSEVRGFPSRRGRATSSKSYDSPPKRTAQRRSSIANLPATPKTCSRRASTSTTSPLALPPASKTPLWKIMTADSAEPMSAVFHFFLSDETLGAIPKLLAECAIPDTFFNEARLAYNVLGGPNGGVRLLAVKVIIEGVARPIVLLWDNEKGFDRMMEAIAREAARRAGDLNVEVRCIKQELTM